MMSEFNYPSFYDFPPFFTLQPVASTREKQLKMWLDFITGFAAHTRKTEINVLEDSKTALFSNAKINRSLPVPEIRQVVGHLCSEGYGEWQDADKNLAIITWRKLEEWSSLIFKWAKDNNKIGDVCTVYELVAGDEVKNQEFRGLDPKVIIGALHVLEKQDRVAIMPNDVLDATGVKFLA